MPFAESLPRMSLPPAVGHVVGELVLALFPETAAVYDHNSDVPSSKACIFFPSNAPHPRKQKKTQLCLLLTMNYY